jgi:Gpi18-like mannosyltransferase
VLCFVHLYYSDLPDNEVMALAFLADWGPGIFLLALSFWTRLISSPVITSDYTYFLSPWFNALKEAPGLTAFVQPFADYSPAYLYLIKILTFFPVHSLYSVKALSELFDIFIALGVVAILYVLGIRSAPRLFLAFAIALALPTVVVNSAFWGQSDSVYAAFVVLSLCFILADKPLGAALAFAVAICFKLQAIFFLPVLVGYLFRRRDTLAYIFLAPFIFFISVVPAWFSGGSLWYWLFIYKKQSTEYTDLSVSAQSLLAFFQPMYLPAPIQQFLFWGALVSGALIALAIAVLVARAGLSSSERMLLLALLSVALLPLVLPRMHERYFYLADIFAVLYALYRPSRWYIPAIVVGASLLSYTRFLSQVPPFTAFSEFDFRIPATMMIVAVALMIWDLVRMPEISPDKRDFFRQL